VLLGATVRADARDDPVPEGVIEEITPQVRLAVRKGLTWLADQQASDGSFGSDGHYGRHVGITGLAGLAFMSAGHVPERGQYGEIVDGCLRFVLTNRSESGLLAVDTSHGPMYGHGFATLFLAEVYGMSGRSEVRETLRKAIRLIVATQNGQGGWRYQPVRSEADISVTICQIMALRSARNAGIAVPKSTIDRAIQYVKDSQNTDGGFKYMLDSGTSAFARSAAGVTALQYAGAYDADEIQHGIAYLMNYLPGKGEGVSHYFYGQYYAAQAMFLRGGASWRTWWPAIREELLERQSEQGHWRSQVGGEYGTAMALIILQIPNRLLPIFQK
jgi:prenyltransferase beta subunit